MAKRYWAAGLGGVLVMIATSQASAQQFTNMVVYGDSLSDTGRAYALSAGTQPPSPPYFMGRFSNGPLWVERLAPDLGFTHNTATNFAVGGARSGATGSIPGTGVLSQVQQSAAVPLNASSLIVVWVGANDYLNAPAAATIAPTVGNIATAVGTVRARGGINFLVPNLPDLGKTPGGAATGQGASLGTLTQLHNTALANAMRSVEAASGAHITVLDIYGLFNDVIANPALYGVTNTTVPCITPLGPTGTCSTAAAAAASVFFDPIHPTATAHQFVSDFAAATLDQDFNGGRFAAMTSYLAPQVLDGMRQGVNSRLNTLRVGNATMPSGVYASGRYMFGSKDDTAGVAAFDYDVQQYTIGFDSAAGDSFIIGGAFTHTEGKIKADLGRGKSDISANGFAIYVSYRTDFYWADVSGGGDWESYDVTRNTGFTPRPTATADVNGQSYYASFDGGLNLAQSDRWNYGPVIGLRYIDTNIDNYTEQDASMLSMNVAAQSDKAVVGSVGAQVSGLFGSGGGMTFLPHLRVVYENELNKYAHRVTTIDSNGTARAVAAVTGQRDRVLVGAGISGLTASNLSFSLDYQGTAYKSGGSDHGIMGRVVYSF
jgi:outer membrane lipase/esterase